MQRKYDREEAWKGKNRPAMSSIKKKRTSIMRRRVILVERERPMLEEVKIENGEEAASELCQRGRFSTSAKGVATAKFITPHPSLILMSLLPCDSAAYNVHP
jgi:hypothetical protein